MDLIASVSIQPTQPFSSVVDLVGKTLGLSLVRDNSGHYEEFPAYVADVLGIEVALLGIPPSVGNGDGGDSYSLLVRTVRDDAPDHNVEVDLSVHLSHMLSAAGLSATPT